MMNLFNDFLVWVQQYIYGGLTASQFNSTIISALGFGEFLPLEYSDFINFATTCFYWLIPIVCIGFIITAFLVIVVFICRFVVQMFRI